mmetsp:Transcript_23904/g.16872  ORF Transcript_23904/g.16872 Transcript_23904/m.16872 type:complete len:118 (+) Transcript_23904:60-413(+)
MSNFMELQANKLDWKLSHDETLFEKMKYLEDNVIASSHLVHNSMNELTRAIEAADTTLHNSVNAFNALNFNKFLENVVEDVDEAERRSEVTRMNNTQILDEMGERMNGEDEKFKYAL